MIEYITGTAPDGSTGKILKFTQSARSDSVRMQIPNMATGQAMFSAWVKAASAGTVWIDVFGAVSLHDIGTGWARISGAGTATINGAVRIGLSAPGTLYVHKAKLESGNKATDWSPSPDDPAGSVKTSSIEILDDAILLTSERTSIRVPGEDSEARDMLVVDSNGVTAQRFSLPSGELLETSDGGEYTVGSGGDYATLADAFSTSDGGIGGKYLTGDVTLKLLNASDPGGTLRGVTGPGRVLITPANMLPLTDALSWSGSPSERWIAGTGAALSVTNRAIRVTVTTAGTNRSAIMRVGVLGAMALAGRTLSFSATVRGSTSANVGYALLYVDNRPIGSPARASSSASQSITATWRVPGSPANSAWWSRVEVRFFANGDTSAAVGSYAEFTNARLEIGDTAAHDNCECSVGTLAIDGCESEIALHDIMISGGTLFGRHAQISLNHVGVFKSGGDGIRMLFSRLVMSDCAGRCNRAVGVWAGAAYLRGTRPYGTLTGSMDAADVSSEWEPGATPPAPSTETLNLYATETGTYIGSGWDTSADKKQLRQGWILSGSKKECFGTALFDMTQIPSGATVQSVKVRLRRISGYGRSGNVTVSVRRSTNAHVSGDVTHAGTAVTKSFGQGDIKNIDITSLYNSNFTGICLDSDDTSDFDGSYSDNYARFTGTGGGDDTRPMLTVTYTI